jgi:prevent-host-death family protein
LVNVPTFEAKNRLSELLAQVARGVEITITKRGVPVAKLVPITPTFDREKSRRAAAGLREASKGVTLGGIAIKDLVDEGRS